MANQNLVVIPAYNEESTIEQVVTLAIKHSDVCVVDDASKDKTPEILAKLKAQYADKIHIIRHEKNTHIPGGVQDGMKYALQKDYQYVVVMDAGMSHDPEMLPLFFAYPDCDLLIGSRQTSEGIPFYRKVISFLGSRVLNYCLSKGIFDFFGPRIKDCTSGYRRYSKKAYTIIANAKLESKAFDFIMEALYLTYNNGGTIKELGIHYVYSNSSFNSRVLKMAIKFAWKLLKLKVYKFFTRT